MASFSVIIPAHNRSSTISRAVASVLNQSHEDYEIILVDDGSNDTTSNIMRVYEESEENITVVTHERRQERVASYNDGMALAKNDWICWLDSDDEYMSNYLEVIDDASIRYPDYRIFNFGSIIHYHADEKEYLTKVRRVFTPGIEGKGHENFSSGQIGTGCFVFKRELLDEIPMMIPTLRPYGSGSDLINDGGPFPEANPNPNYPQREDGQWVPMGNPWGQDYHWFWLLTRDNLSCPLDMLLYIEHKRRA